MSGVRSVRHGWCALAAVLLIALALAGCGGGNSDSGSPHSVSSEKAAGGSGAQALGDEGSGKPGEAGGKAKNVKLDPNSGARSVSYTGTLKVRAKNIDEATVTAKQLVTGAGGYVENESSASSAGRTSLTFKIPTDRYAATLEQLTGRLGTKLELRQQAADLTEEVADVDSRVRSAQATLASFRKLLDRAKTIGEVINVEQEIETRQSDLESLQNRQKRLHERIRYATLTLELSGPVVAAPKPEPKDEASGFAGGLKKGWDAFVAVISGLLLALGLLLPFLVTAGVLAAIALTVRRFVLARRTPAPAPPPEASG